MSEYTPVLDGEELETECGDLATSLRNIDRIARTGHARVEDVYAYKGKIVVQYHTGERIWASGLSTQTDEAVSALLDVLLDAHPTLGTQAGAALHRVVAGLPATFSGSLSRFVRAKSE